MPTITKTIVDSTQPGTAQLFVWDDKLPGFGLRITPSGVKSFVVQYRPPTSSKTTRMTVGRYGKLTVDQARTEAKKLLAQATMGDDPAAARREKRKASLVKPMTVNDMLDKFISGHVEVNNKPSTQKEEKRLIDRLIRPALGKLALSELTRGEVKQWHVGITGAKVSANRALAHLKRACKFAIEHEWMTDNPCSAITLNKETARDRYFSDDELKRIGEALRVLVAEGKLMASLADGIRLLALTGMRAGEARALRWADYDPARRLLYLRDAKAGARSVPLFSEAVDLLKGMETLGEWVITGPKPQAEVGEYYFIDAMRAVLEQAKVTDASLHTFRHTLATYMAQNGQDVWAIGGVHGWKTLAMVQRYVARHSVGERHLLPANQRIAMALAGGNVVPRAKTA